MRLLKIFAIAAFTSILCTCSSSPDLLVRGRILDAATHSPIEGARIHEGRYAPDLAAGSTSDSFGAFAYSTYPEEHTIHVEKAGYASFTATIGLDPFSRQEELEIKLYAEANAR